MRNFFVGLIARFTCFFPKDWRIFGSRWKHVNEAARPLVRDREAVGSMQIIASDLLVRSEARC